RGHERPAGAAHRGGARALGERLHRRITTRESGAESGAGDPGARAYDGVVRPLAYRERFTGPELASPEEALHVPRPEAPLLGDRILYTSELSPRSDRDGAGHPSAIHDELSVR